MTTNHTPTYSRYHAGCRCEGCLAAGREHRRRGLPGGDPRHGLNGYVNFGCRCVECRAANAARTAYGRRARGNLLVDDPRHGTTNAYNNFSCRCDACRSAWATYQREYYARRDAS